MGTVVNGSVLSNMFSDPQNFAQTFQNADPSVVQKVISMMNDLIKENDDDQAKAIQAWNDAVDERKKAFKAMDDALKDRTFKEGELSVAEEKRVEQQDKTNLKAAEETSALNALNGAKDHHMAQKAFLAKETSRLDNEKKVLEEVLSILDDLKDDNSGRRLLSASADAKVFLAGLLKQSLAVDPAALDAVVASVKNLIAAGEDLRAAAIKDEKRAAAAVEKAQEELDFAQKCHAEAVAALEQREHDVAMYTKSVKEARDVYKARVSDHNSAVKKESEALDFKDSEIARVKDENKSFTEVKDILKKLL